MPKIHLAVERTTRLGGVDTHITGTLCGRESGELVERNAETSNSGVTCKLCRQILDDPKHWRHRKWLGEASPQPE